jgi:hypothetical protein
VTPACCKCQSPTRLAGKWEVTGGKRGWVYLCSRYPKCQSLTARSETGDKN